MKIVAFETREAASGIDATEQVANGVAVDGAGDETVPLVDEAAVTPDNNIVLLHKAARLILAFVASESAEIVSSLWSMVMLPFLYVGRNKAWFYVIQDMDDAAYCSVMYYKVPGAVPALQ
jgi:hypothetical protein